MSQWQKVYRSGNRPRAELVKDLLESRGLMPILLDKKDSAYPVFGYFELLVPAEEVLEAIKIIQDEVQFGEGQ